MIATLLLAASVPTAVDAELAFARDARRLGQWTAFRKYAAKDAVMFTPRAAWARDFLMDRKDPPEAISWRPALSFISCDGRTAVNTGPWFRVGGAKGGYFTTVWQRSGKGWRWAYDGGGPIKGAPPRARPAQVHRAICTGKAPGAPIIPPPARKAKQITPADQGRGQSDDKTLGWDWKVDKKGGRKFRLYLWNGARYVEALHNDVPPP